MDAAIGQLSPLVGVKAACRAVGRPRSSHYHRRAGRPPTPPTSRKGQAQPRSLSVAERCQVVDVLHDERFVDQVPASVYASLLDGGRYLASISSMYCILHDANEMPGDRRRHATDPAHV